MDGVSVLPQLVDSYAATTTFLQEFGPYVLPDAGTHTITFVNTSQHNAASSGYRIALDTFIIEAPTNGATFSSQGVPTTLVTNQTVNE